MAEEFVMDIDQFHLSEEQKFLFDLKGYIVIPDVFNQEQVEAMKAQVIQDKHNKKNTIPGGASECILSNNVVKAAIHSLLGANVRFDSLLSVLRTKGMSDGQGPHQGGPMRNPHFHYHYTEGQIHSGMLRLFLELNDVSKEDGGTIMLAGSHKSRLPIPQSYREKKAKYPPPFETYEVKAGSIIFFSENVCHAGPEWNNPDYPRVAISFTFTDIGMRWHRYSHVSQDVIEQLGPAARWYFRDTWVWDNSGANEGRNQLLVNQDGSVVVSP